MIYNIQYDSTPCRVTHLSISLDSHVVDIGTCFIQNVMSFYDTEFIFGWISFKNSFYVINIKVNEDSDMKKTHLNSLAMSVDIMLCEKMKVVFFSWFVLH